MTFFKSAIQIWSARLKSPQIEVIKNVLDIKNLVSLGRMNHETD